MYDDFKSKAVSKCIESQHALTPQRILILETLFDQHKPVSAYEMKDIFETQGNKFNIATIYRVMEFWCSLSVVHRISGINKFVCCTNPNEKHTHIISCCQKCEASTESCHQQMGLDLDTGVNALGLTLAQNSHLEFPVICSNCA